MGAVFSEYFGTNINQTQIQSAQQTCSQTFKGTISDVTITVIDSHIGDLELSNSIIVGDVDCVQTTMLQSTADSAVKNAAESTQNIAPFALTEAKQNFTDITNIASYQQALINQSCIQSVDLITNDVSITYIDSTTGNIKIANSAQVQSFNCNLQAMSYQTASASVTNTAKGSQTVGCCATDCGLVFIVIIALAAMGGFAKKMQSDEHGGDSSDIALSNLVIASRLSPPTSTMPSSTPKAV